MGIGGRRWHAEAQAEILAILGLAMRVHGDFEDDVVAFVFVAKFVRSPLRYEEPTAVLRLLRRTKFENSSSQFAP